MSPGTDGAAPGLRRRQLLAAAAAGVLAGCERAAPELPGGYTGMDMDRGHALRDRLARGGSYQPDSQRRTQVLIAGAGVAGLAAARALRLAGVE
nr:hypothetical protein [Ottowia sp.]